MSRWLVGNEAGDELVKSNDESVINRWKSMMRRWVGAELVISRCLSEVYGFLDTKEEFFPLTYYLNLTSPVTSTRTSVRLFIMQPDLKDNNFRNWTARPIFMEFVLKEC